MPSVAYDKSLYRTGFRPQHTDPFAATQMSGIFSPQHLHGMGQGGGVFTRTGGWGLHGLGDAGIPNGSLITYQGVWTSMFNTGLGSAHQGDPQSIVDDVVNAINADGQLTVMQKPSGLTGFLAALGVSSGEPFNVTLVLQVTNGQGFGNVNDVISIVRHYVYQISTQFPQTDAVTRLQVPDAPTTSTSPDYQRAGLTSAGLPGGLPSAVPPPFDFGKWLSDNALWLGMGVVGVIFLPKVLGR